MILCEDMSVDKGLRVDTIPENFMLEEAAEENQNNKKGKSQERKK